MNKYIATFYSHYDAIVFYDHLKKKGVEAKLAPTPRKVSASCGTCVIFLALDTDSLPDDEVEAIYKEGEIT
ncbi:MAG: DUF3343 domain-containing protein [Defluviitaleaceae bacterium]|nr:DUF3343 domain-containing protein [Defluviitaleaceae bacterium]